MNDLYWFNPDNEMSIANGNANYTLPANIAAMAADLSSGWKGGRDGFGSVAYSVERTFGGFLWEIERGRGR